MLKRIIIAAAAAACLVACAPKEQKVMAREVPERMDDFIWENNLIAFRAYGKALEGNPTSPGFDVWVKLPGKLVANEWYEGEKTEPNYYHKDHGGKDCYKVAVSLGAGGSAPIVNDTIQYPATNYRSSEILEQDAEKVVFVLHYPEWEMAGGVKVSLDKKITVVADTYFCKCEDTYTFTGAETIDVAAGIFRHADKETIVEELTADDRYAVWEHASDQSVEPEDGLIGVAVVVPGANYSGYDAGRKHGVCVRTVRSGEKFCYSFGSCWSKGDVKTASDWFNMVKAL